MPYIPKQHEIYDLLPDSRAHGGEVFSYPSALLSKIEAVLGSSEGVMPYGFESLAAYERSLDRMIEQHAKNAELTALLTKLKAEIRRMNEKDIWSVVRYVGSSNAQPIDGLTPGRAYYWPTTREEAIYDGVIDDEEFTSYQYPTSPELWEILEDPTGMAHRTIYEGAKGHLTRDEHASILKILSE